MVSLEGSVHNQRTERLWRDVFAGCISFFYNLFYALEDASLLDPKRTSIAYTMYTPVVFSIN